jgi:hypothetical protein
MPYMTQSTCTYVRMYVCVYVCKYERLFVCGLESTYVHFCVCMHVCMHVWTLVCMWICTHTFMNHDRSHDCCIHMLCCTHQPSTHTSSDLGRTIHTQLIGQTNEQSSYMYDTWQTEVRTSSSRSRSVSSRAWDCLKGHAHVSEIVWKGMHTWACMCLCAWRWSYADKSEKFQISVVCFSAIFLVL